MIKKAFVTGAAGFVAQHLVDLLVKEGYEVTCLIKHKKNSKSIEHLPVKIIRGDLKKPEELNGIIPEGSFVFHCYSLSPGAHASKEIYHQENVLSTINLLNECEKSAIKKLIYISSCSIVSPNVTKSITEETPPSPDNFYGKSKLEAEGLIKQYYQKHKIPSIILRLSSIFGPGMHPKTSSVRLFKMVQKPIFPMVGTGTDFYEFSYVKNVVAGIYLASQKINDELVLLNITDIKKISFKELISTISAQSNSKLKIIHLPYSLAMGLGYIGNAITKVTGKRFPFRTRTVKGVTGGWVADPSKAVNKIGLIQPYSINHGIEETLAWLISNNLIQK